VSSLYGDGLGLADGDTDGLTDADGLSDALGECDADGLALTTSPMITTGLSTKK